MSAPSEPRYERKTLLENRNPRVIGISMDLGIFAQEDYSPERRVLWLRPGVRIVKETPIPPRTRVRGAVTAREEPRP